MKSKCLAVFFALCILPFQIFSKDKQELATELSKLMFPIEAYTLYRPLANDIMSSINLDGIELNEAEKKALAYQIYDAILRNILDCDIKAKVEVYSKEELTALLQHYQSNKGKAIIKKIMQAGENKQIKDLNDLEKILNQDEKAYMENIQLSKSGKSAYNKADKQASMLMQNIQENAAVMGNKTKLLTEKALLSAKQNVSGN